MNSKNPKTLNITLSLCLSFSLVVTPLGRSSFAYGAGQGPKEWGEPLEEILAKKTAGQKFEKDLSITRQGSAFFKKLAQTVIKEVVALWYESDLEIVEDTLKYEQFKFFLKELETQASSSAQSQKQKKEQLEHWIRTRSETVQTYLSSLLHQAENELERIKLNLFLIEELAEESSLPLFKKLQERRLSIKRSLETKDLVELSALLNPSYSFEELRQDLLAELSEIYGENASRRPLNTEVNDLVRAVQNENRSEAVGEGESKKISNQKFKEIQNKNAVLIQEALSELLKKSHEKDVHLIEIAELKKELSAPEVFLETQGLLIKLQQTLFELLLSEKKLENLGIISSQIDYQISLKPTDDLSSQEMPEAEALEEEIISLQKTIEELHQKAVSQLRKLSHHQIAFALPEQDKQTKKKTVYLTLSAIGGALAISDPYFIHSAQEAQMLLISATFLFAMISTGIYHILQKANAYSVKKFTLKKVQDWNKQLEFIFDRSGTLPEILTGLKEQQKFFQVTIENIQATLHCQKLLSTPDGFSYETLFDHSGTYSSEAESQTQTLDQAELIKTR
jgi:ribosomal protein L22